MEKSYNILNSLYIDSNNENIFKNENNSLIMESCYMISNSSFEEEKNSLIEEDKNNIFKYKKNNIYNYINFKILKFISIIGTHKNSAEFIKELNNNFFISSGTDNKIIIYNSRYIQLKTIKFLDWIYYISETNNKQKDIIEFIACSNKMTSLIRFYYNNNRFCIDKINKEYSFCLELEENNFLVCNKNGIFLKIGFLSSIIEEKEELKIYNKRFKAGIKLNKICFVLTSNSIFPGGEDKLIVYNIITKKIFYEIEGYSFNFSSNNLSLISKNENKILFCPCKKYTKNQKNGILLVKFQFEKENKIEKIFYDTGSFEVYCFCQIYTKDKLNNSIFEENILKYETDYILVGGFETFKFKGNIKLYKIINNENFIETKIEYIQDIEIDNNDIFKGFNGPITSIIQSKRDCHILISCFDGNIYLFNPPNIDYFLFYDNKI